MQYRSVEPEEFNRLLDQFDSKGSLLSCITLRLITDQLKQEKSLSPVLILCDKHGGRNHYLDLLTGFFSEELIQTVRESRASSVYRLTSAGRKLEFRFLAKGESQIPIALASMLSKYRRELAMIRFNEFWQSHIADLRPTAGYPEDAKRFKRDIAAVQAELGIADDSIWRKR
jgi:ribonuclease HIII